MKLNGKLTLSDNVETAVGVTLHCVIIALKRHSLIVTF